MKKIKITENDIKSIVKKTIKEQYGDYKLQPISLESVKEKIMDELQNWDSENPNMERDADELAKKIMERFNLDLEYISEEYEWELEKIAYGNKE